MPEFSASRRRIASLVWAMLEFDVDRWLLSLLFEHDLVRKPVSTFRNHASQPIPTGTLPFHFPGSLNLKLPGAFSVMKYATISSI